jgi:hypothetical protein
MARYNGRLLPGHLSKAPACAFRTADSALPNSDLVSRQCPTTAGNPAHSRKDVWAKIVGEADFEVRFCGVLVNGAILLGDLGIGRDEILDVAPTRCFYLGDRECSIPIARGLKDLPALYQWTMGHLHELAPELRYITGRALFFNRKPITTVNGLCDCPVRLFTLRESTFVYCFW